MSKTHPNMSQEFTYKRKIRVERKMERNLLLKAKEIYHEIYGFGSILYRSKLNQIKQALKVSEGTLNY